MSAVPHPHRIPVVALVFAVTALAASCAGKKPPLTVHVVDGLSGQPVAGVPVTWAFSEPDEDTGGIRRLHETAGTTDASGICLFEAIPPDRVGPMQSLIVEARAEGYCATTHADSFMFQAGRGLELELGILPVWTSGTVSGDVRDAVSAKPLAGVRILIVANRIPEGEAEKSGDPRFLPTAEYEAMTDGDGHFSVEVDHFALDRDSYWLMARAEHEGWSYSVQDLGAERVVEGSKIRANYAHVHCATWLSNDQVSGQVEGVLRDAQGHPVAGEELIASGVRYENTCARGCHGGEAHTSFVEPVTTDQDGRFHFSAGVPFFYGLAHGLRVVRGTDMQYWRTPLPIGEHQGEHELHFTDGKTVELTISVSGSGKPA